MENFINSLPKPLLAFLAIALGVAMVFLTNPPHTVCDSQEEIIKESQRGTLFPKEFKKNKIPPLIGRAKEACQIGNSPGSCFEYFGILKGLAKEVGNFSSECVSQLYNIKEVSAAINDGIELMVRLAWGVKPPELGPSRQGWMQEAELATFCQLKNVFLQVNGEDSWKSVRLKIYNKLPGEELPMAASPTAAVLEPKKALAVLSEEEIFNRSLFSVRCDTF